MVGSGIFFTSGYLIQETNNPWLVLLAWIVGGFLAFCGAITFAYSARLFPFAGGDYVYLKKAYSPILAFVSGWSSLLTNFSACVSVLGLAFGKYCLLLFPSLPFLQFFAFSFLGIQFEFGTVQILGAFPIVFFSAFNYFGIQSAIRVQNFFTILKILGLSLFLILGFSVGSVDWNYIFKFSPPNFLSSEDSLKLILGIVPVSFSYLGWNMITYVAEEVKDPDKNLVRASVTACLLVSFLYVLLNTLFLVSAPMEELSGQAGIGAIAFSKLFGAEVSILPTGFITWVILGSMSAILMGGSRIYVAMARDGVFFPSFAKLHPKFQSPSTAILFQAGISLAFLLVKEIESLLYMITCSILILSCLTAFTPFRFKNLGYQSSYKIPFFPLPPILYIAANLVVVIVLFKEKPVQALWGLAITASAIPIYYSIKQFTNNTSLKIEN